MKVGTPSLVHALTWTSLNSMGFASTNLNPPSNADTNGVVGFAKYFEKSKFNCLDVSLHSTIFHIFFASEPTQIRPTFTVVPANLLDRFLPFGLGVMKEKPGPSCPLVKLFRTKAGNRCC